MIVHPIYNNVKITANEFAKWAVADKGETASYWREMDSVVTNKMTEKEQDDIDEAISKHIERVRKFLGIHILDKKVFDKGGKLYTPTC